MGTDIHGGFIKLKEDGSKQPLKTSWNMNRDYTLFAILSGVRNGFGFAGCYRHEPLQPIAEGRGLPQWLTLTSQYGEEVDGTNLYTEELPNKWFGRFEEETNEFGCWLGDHSHTYMTTEEILNWQGWNNKLSRGGVVDIDHYKETVAKGVSPEHWSGGVGGGKTYVVEQHQLPFPTGATHVRCTWEEDETLGTKYEDFIEEVKRLQEENGVCYLVVGFDS